MGSIAAKNNLNEKEEKNIVVELSDLTSKYETQEKKAVAASSIAAQEDNSVAPFTQRKAEKKLVKRINWTFIPFVCLILFIQFIDKTTLSLVSVLSDFYKETGISHDEYAWLGSIFYFGFLCVQLPNNYMLQKFPVSKYVGVNLVIWGVCLLCMAFAHNFSQLAALRWLLGFFEGITYPSMFLLIATLYRRSEQVIWFGALFMSNGVAMILGSLIGVGIMQIPTVNGISAWKWTFIIFGMITTVMGLFYFFFLPDKPMSRWFRLTEEEKLIVEERTRDNAVVPTRKINYHQIWTEGLRDLRFYCYCLIAFFLCLQNGALTIFSSIIISEMGFSNTNAVLLTIPSGAVSCILVLIAINISKRKNEIILVAMAFCTISLIGLVILFAIPSGPVKLLGIYLSWSDTSAYVLLQTSIANNVSGYTKKIFYTSGNMVFYTFGNFVGPILLKQKDSPRYLMGIGVYVAANAIVICLFAYIRFSYVQANKKRNLNKSLNIVALPEDLEDITDVQNKNFVYRT